MQDPQAAWAHVGALTRQPVESAVIDIRMLHDSRKDLPAYPMRGTLPQLWSSIVQWQDQGYGAFINVNDMDGQGRENGNVRACRAAVIDLDNLSAQQNYERACNWSLPPQFAVNSSPGKYHVYWLTPYYTGNEFYTLQQRKLRQFFDGDRGVIDPARVLRLAGTLHLKNPQAPHLVTCHALAGYGQATSLEALTGALSAVNVIDGGDGVRHPLGDPAMAAPSIEWVQRVMDLTDPNSLDRGEWISFTAAIKQAAWSLTDPVTLESMWSAWCARYEQNDVGENAKQWKSLTTTEVGWPSLARRVPQVQLERLTPTVSAGSSIAEIDKVAAPPPLDCSGEMLTHLEQREWFKGCVFITDLTKIMTADREFLNAGQFNVRFGGKLFLWTQDGKSTDEAWKAATRGTQFKVPMVSHTRFLPSHPFGEIVADELGHEGINTYKPATIRSVKGDPSLFLRHIAFMLPHEGDQRILLDYLAHNIKYPGYKIPWAPVIQSVEGAGKGVIETMMRHAMGGRAYFYNPNTKDLAESGQKFNAWMKDKLFILADEIKVDDRRDMIEILKPMITQEVIQMQAKGVDQKNEDNFSNWLFFTNYKDAVPINQNSRRFCIFYSAFQSKEQLQMWGLGDSYFATLYDWIKGEGAAIMHYYFTHDYALERGKIPMRAPDTSSTPEVMRMSLGAVERMIHEAVTDELPGFAGGWVSAAAVRKRMTDTGLRQITSASVEKIIVGMGYREIGRSPRPYMEEDHRQRSMLFHTDPSVSVDSYGRTQGYHDA